MSSSGSNVAKVIVDEELLTEDPNEAAKASNNAEAYPRKFGDYLLLNAFAQGGMGEVYLAKSSGIEGIDRLCVLKKLRSDVAGNAEYLGRFIDEARVVVQLSHANIAHVFDVGAVGDDHYLAMEYVSGANAREIQVRASEEEAHGLDPGLAGQIVSQVLDALEYAHGHKHPITGQALNLVHRDVSPQNVMVSYEGEVKLIDFGLASSELKEEQTESQVVMGKVAYMSPEQARGEEADARTDQFAAGIILYELLTGERFYGEKNNYQIWQVVGQGGFVPKRFTALEPELTRILSRALAAERKQRYPSCSEFRDDLEIFVRTQHPHATKRALRELLERLFERDQLAERQFTAQFANITADQACSVAPGKARSFIATEASTSTPLSLPKRTTKAPVASDTEIVVRAAVTKGGPEASLQSDQRAETSIAAPEQLRDPQPDLDGTQANLREAYPRSKAPLFAAAVAILLLLLGIAFLVADGDVADERDALLASGTNAETPATSTDAPGSNKPLATGLRPAPDVAKPSLPDNKALSAEGVGAEKPPSQAVAKMRSAPLKRGSRRAVRAVATRRKAAQGTSLGTKPTTTGKALGPDLEADNGEAVKMAITKRPAEQTPHMNVAQSEASRLHDALRNFAWRQGTNNARAQVLLKRCADGNFINATRQKMARRDVADMPMVSINGILAACRKNSAP